MYFLNLYYKIEILNQYGKYKNKPMKKLIISALLLGITGGGIYAREKVISHGYPITPVPFTSVKLTDSFWGQRLQASREVTIPLAFSKCEETGRYKNFEMAATPVTAIK